MTSALGFIAMCLSLSLVRADSDYGSLIFEDDFDRTESQELKDEPGNAWTTSSEKTAKGHKEVDLRDGYMYIYTHAEANHATSVRHAFVFTDGTLGLRMKLYDTEDVLTLNFADPELDSVWAGHLFKVVIGVDEVQVIDQKTGTMNLEIKKARKNGSLTIAQKEFLQEKIKSIPGRLEVGVWHQVYVTVFEDKLSVEINEEQVGSFRSEGFGHESKRLLRLLVKKNAAVDDIKMWQFK